MTPSSNTELTTRPFHVEFDVRDYECDMEGIVNNAVYMNYLEHARHVYLKQIGLDFARLTRAGIHLVVVRVEMDYKWPLRSGDRFKVTVRASQLSPLRFAFYQSIIRIPDDKPILEAVVTGTALNEQGRPSMPDDLRQLLAGNEPP